MKRAFLLTGLMMIVFATACNKIKQLTNINVDIPYNQQVSVPHTIDSAVELPPGGLSITFPALAIATNSRQYIDSFHTSTNEVLRVNLNALSMKIATAADLNFNFLDSIQVYITGQALPQQLIAYSYNIPKGLDSLSLDTVANTNLKQYFLLDTMYIQLTAHFTAIPPGNTQLNINSVFHLLANPLY